jgi:hydroxymethylbilane synthase
VIATGGNATLRTAADSYYTSAMTDAGQKLRLGTRGSLLATAQSKLIAAELMRVHPGLEVELITVRTTGDRITDRPLYDVGGKGLFTKELEQALLAGAIDLAVHSFKDVPITMPLVEQSDLITAAVPAREDPRDVLLSFSARTIEALPRGARIGTGSLRRRSQLLALRPDLAIEPIRGNIDTRMHKLRRGDFDAIVLALAGLRRAGLFDESIATPLTVEQMLPAPGQGALSLQCRREDRQTLAYLAAIDDRASAACVKIERKVVEILQGDCHSPIAALAVQEGGGVRLRVALGQEGGAVPVRWADVTSRGSGDASIASKACEALALR